MEEQGPEQDADPIRTCAYSGERRPESQMVRIGRHYVAAEFKDAAVQFLHQGNEFAHVGADMQAPPVRLGPLLGKSWEIIRRHWLLLLLIHVTMELPLNILEGFVTSRMDPVENNVRLACFSIGVNGIFASVGHAAVFGALSRIWQGKAPSYGDAWFQAMRRLGNVVLASLFVMILVVAGLVLCIAPGLVASVWLAFTICIVMDERRAAWPAVERSAAIAQGRFWAILGYLLVITIPLTGFIFVYLFIAAFVPVLNHWLLGSVILTVVALPLFFVVIFTFVLYKALRSAPAVVH